MLRRLEQRGYIKFLSDDNLGVRATHMGLSTLGRQLADSLASLEGSDALVLTSDISPR